MMESRGAVRPDNLLDPVREVGWIALGNPVPTVASAAVVGACFVFV